MAEFCTNCGAPLSGTFCGRCGHRAQSASAPAQPASPTSTPVAAPPASPQSSLQQPTSTQPPAAQQSIPQQPSAQPPLAQQSASQPLAAQPPKSSGGGKALLIVGGIVLVLVLSAFGSVLYGVYWVKHKVSSINGGSFNFELSQGNMCKLLSTTELQQALGVTIERSAEVTENGDPGCAYYTNSAAFAQLQKIAVEQARRDSERVSNEPGANANSKNDNPLELLKHTKEMEGIVKGLGLSQPDASGKVFTFSVNRNFGAGNWGPLRTTLSVVPGFDEVNGVGDHAMIGSFGHAFYVLKGDSMFTLETMYLPEARVRGSEIANKMISHL